MKESHQTGAVTRRCEACVSYRKATPGDPLAGWHVLSPKIYELRSRWEKHLTERALFEQQRFEASLPFDFEPLAYAYCDYYTRKTGAGTFGKAQEYVLCFHQNPDGDCPEFQPKDDTQ